MKVSLQPPQVPGRTTPVQQREALAWAEKQAAALRNRILEAARRTVAHDEGDHDYHHGLAGDVLLDNAEAQFQAGARVAPGEKLTDGSAQGLDHYHYDDGHEIQRFRRDGTYETYTLKKRFQFAPLNAPYSAGPWETKGSSTIDWEQKLELDTATGTATYQEADLIGSTVKPDKLEEVYDTPPRPGPQEHFSTQSGFIPDDRRPWLAAGALFGALAYAAVPAWAGVLSAALGNPLPAVAGALAAGIGASVQEARDPSIIDGGFRPGHFVIPAIAAGLGALSPALAGVVTLGAVGLGALGAHETLQEWD